MIDENMFDFLSVIKSLLNINDTEKDSILSSYILVVKSSILNYCNLDELPPALYMTLCSLVCDVYNENAIKNTGDIVGNITSVTEDGRTVAFSNGSELKLSVNDKISHLSELKRFRKLYRK